MTDFLFKSSPPCQQRFLTTGRTLSCNTLGWVDICREKAVEKRSEWTAEQHHNSNVLACRINECMLPVVVVREEQPTQNSQARFWARSLLRLMCLRRSIVQLIPVAAIGAPVGHRVNSEEFWLVHQTNVYWAMLLKGHYVVLRRNLNSEFQHLQY